MALHPLWRYSWRIPTHTNAQTSGRTRLQKVTFARQQSVFLLMFTTFWSSGAQSSLSSLCSALAHVVFFMSNLILNLNPAITSGKRKQEKWVFTAWNPHFPRPTPTLVPLPVWWRRRRCAGQTGEWSQTWRCTW